MKNETITMVQCPSCEVGWIDEAHEFVCSDCVPKVQADLAAYDLHKAIQNIDKLSIEHIKQRLPILRRAKDHLDAIIEMSSR